MTQKKLLALDGGGIRGVISLGILAAIEKAVGQPLGKYFDYIGGTSTGAIIAAGLATGLSVQDLYNFYLDFGPQMFEPRFLLQRYKSLYASDPLQQRLKKTFGEDTTLGHLTDPLLLIVTRNWTTDSPWPISSNPSAYYNDSTRQDCNLQIPLWQLVRASTAAPIYFPPEVLQWDKGDSSKSFVFVDGGVTPYNNPAFLLYRMATVPEYNLNWETGEDKMLIVSVGTGSAPKTGPTFQDPDQSIPWQIPGLISALMYGAEVEQDISCRTVGRCVYGNVIDRELGDMIRRENDDRPGLKLKDRLALTKIPLTQCLGKQFLYARYNAELTMEGLGSLGVEDCNLEQLRRMDLATTENIAKLSEIGKAAGERVHRDHFGSFIS
jgi:predicted acylesterase/phospholipase RssA